MAEAEPVGMSYPDARRNPDCAREYTNVKGEKVTVAEPYDWLEDSDSKQTSEWVQTQVKMFNDYVGDCKMETECSEKMTEMLNFERYSTPNKKGNRFFWRYNTGLQNHSVLYTSESLEAEPRILIDPNTLSDDGTTALGSTFLSEDASLMAYTISKGGSDWCEILVMSVGDAKNLGDHLLHCKFTSVAWLHSGEGFFYCRYADPQVDDLGTETKAANNQKIFFHKVGTAQSEDTLLMEAKGLGNEEFMFGVEVSEDGAYLIITVSESCAPKNMLYVAPLANFDISSPKETFAESNIIKTIDEMDAEYEYYGNDGKTFYVVTNKDAPNKRVCSLNIDSSELVDIISENECPIQQFRILNKDLLCVNYMKDVCSSIKFFNMDGSKNNDVPMSFKSADLTVSGCREHGDLFVYETSFLTPGTIHYMDLTKDSKSFSVFKEAKVPGYDSSEYQAKQVFYKSKDGTKIPMFILSKKSVELNGKNPTCLYGYGGFNISITPGFSVSKILWMQLLGGVYAIANIRGGGEYGENWHQQGIKDRKQNVFDDFCNAGEYLIEQKYTSNENLCIEGGSNGGLLVGACCNQRPDLFAVGLAHVGVMDMLRFNKFTIGYAWCSDFGNPDESEEFDALYAYSPLHNIPALPEGKQYPSFLGLTADHDDRVVPLHTMKFMAQLQHSVGSNTWQTNPLLTLIEVKAGHGAGKSLSKQIAQRAKIMAFVAKCLRIG